MSAAGVICVEMFGGMKILLNTHSFALNDKNANNEKHTGVIKCTTSDNIMIIHPFHSIKLVRKLVIILTLFLFWGITNLSAQKLAIKSNLPYLATATPNIGIEAGLSEKYTLSLTYGINPFTFDDNKKWKHWIVRSELRYWPCERFYGHFFGLHAAVGEYNISRVNIPFVKDSRNFRYEGKGALAGLTYGYSWILGSRWNMEVALGAGMVYVDYDKFDCITCGSRVGESRKSFFAPTNAALNIIYLIK